MQENSSREETVGEIIHYKIKVKKFLISAYMLTHTLAFNKQHLPQRYLVYEFKTIN